MEVSSSGERDYTAASVAQGRGLRRGVSANLTKQSAREKYVAVTKTELGGVRCQVQ